MLKLIGTAGTVAANGIIPFTVDFNSNTKVSFANNAVTINNPGYYEINATFNATATAATTNVTLYANGTAIPETAITITTTAADEYEIVINDIEKVIKNFADLTKVSLTFVTTTGLTITNANVSVKEIR